MTSRQHQDWLNRGKPDSGLALPLQLLANTLSAAGYTVYVYPNDAHLDDEPPQDHTYYSETGWPHPSPKWWRHAIDVMPGHAGLPTLQQIGQTLFNARQAGQITWLKYMNWPSDGNLSRAVQDRWEPGHSRGSSSDTGHIHLSSTTGCETLDSSINPLTAVVVNPPGGPVTLSQDDVVDICSGVVQWATRAGALPAGYRGANTNLLSIEAQIIRVQADVATVKAAVAAPAPVVLSADQLAQVVAAVTSALQGIVPTTEEIAATVDAAVKRRLDGATVHTAGS